MMVFRFKRRTAPPYNPVAGALGLIWQWQLGIALAAIPGTVFRSYWTLKSSMRMEGSMCVMMKSALPLTVVDTVDIYAERNTKP